MSKLCVFLARKSNEIIISYFILLSIFFIYPFDVENKVNTVKVAGTFRLDHVLHVLIFIPSSFVIFNKFNLKLFYILFLVILMSFFFEFLQWFLPYRAFTIKDLEANLMGAFLSFLLLFLLKNMKTH